jgi:hypothetical protein
MTRLLIGLLGLTLLPGWAAAQLPAATRSFSGQFIAHPVRFNRATALPPDLLTNRHTLELQPELLAVSAERIKQSLWLDLGAHPDWRDPIHLTLRPARSAEDVVDIRLERFKNTWTYRVELPVVVERQKFVRAMVSVILLEIANRSARERSTELPAWLTEGLTQRLLEFRGKELLLPPPRPTPGGLLFTPTVNEVRVNDPMREVRARLKQYSPVTIEELSWPTDAQLNGLDDGRYRESAGLFVTELIQLPEGRASLRTMLNHLAGCFNWQTAFHQAFAANFPRPLDLEKWWALEIAHFNGRDPDRLWTMPDSLQKLAELLEVAVAVRPTRTNLPANSVVTVQRVVQEWDTLRQLPVLKAKVIELDGLRLRVAPELIPLVDDYRKAIATYLNRRTAPGFAFQSGRTGPPAVQQLTRETVRWLNELDRRRAEISSPPEPARAADS